MAIGYGFGFMASKLSRKVMVFTGVAPQNLLYPLYFTD